MNLRQHKRRHARRLASRPAGLLRLYRLRYLKPASVRVDVQVRMMPSLPPLVLEPGQWAIQDIMDRALAKLVIEGSRVYP